MLHKRYFYFSSQTSTKIEQYFGIESAFSVIEQNLFVFLPEKAKTDNCF